MAVVLCIWDGWGCSSNPSSEHNAIALAATPNYDRLLACYPNTKLQASGAAVGLPAGQMGNSEVGHMTIGAGRIIPQQLPRIDSLIADGRLFNSAAFEKLIKHHHPKSSQLPSAGQLHSIHLLGLISDGGVHSHIDHLVAIAQHLGRQSIAVKLHLITDGRDVPPRSAAGYLEKISDLCTTYPSITVATLAGRYYTMDRDNRHERTAAAAAALNSKATTPVFDTAQDYITASYKQNLFDEFIMPARAADYNGIKPGDSILTLNYRADRIRQILYALLETVPAASIYTISDTGIAALSDNIIVHKEDNHNNLGQRIADRGLSQLRLAETEKYPHVTFFFNGGNEVPYPNEDRILIPSPNVSHYELQPEMSARHITAALEKALASRRYAFICVNYANADMVGHSGNLAATIAACETLDVELEKIIAACKQYDAHLILTSDHGNAEELFDQKNNDRHTAHTTNLVPCIYYHHWLSDDDISPVTISHHNTVAPAAAAAFQKQLGNSDSGGEKGLAAIADFVISLLDADNAVN